MRNITGPPAEDADFFNRPRDLKKLAGYLDNKSSIFLSAPRRVGKTSLILRLCTVEREAGRRAVFMNVEGCGDELTFVEKLLEELTREGLYPEMLNRVNLLFRKARESLGGTKVGAAGVNFELGGDDPDFGTIRKALESVLRKIEESDIRTVIAIDEMPELLLTLSRGEQGRERVGNLLHLLRSLRQSFRKSVRWVFLGSIGLDTFVDSRDLRITINDLESMNLEALTREEADKFLTQLGQDNDFPIQPEQRKRIVELVDWPLLYHLQIFFHALVDLEKNPASVGAVDAAFEYLLLPQNFSHFETWRQRLAAQFEADDARMARDILRYLCQHKEGRTRDQILTSLMSTRMSADPSEIGEQLASLLKVLQGDGYLLGSQGCYAFRSFLLREFWYRREVL